MIWRDDWLLLPQRFALHLPSATAVLADIHLGYSAARQRLGDAVPSRSVREEMQPLFDARASRRITQVLVAGDLFEGGYSETLAGEFLDSLMQQQMTFLGLTPGNHDRGIAKASTSLPTFGAGYDLAGWHVVHGDRPVEHAKTLKGHWHPAVRRERVKSPCFLAKDTHLVLPAFSLDAAGVDVSKDKRWRDWTRFAIGCNSVVEVKK